jgi:hypothetical protein
MGADVELQHDVAGGQGDPRLTPSTNEKGPEGPMSLISLEKFWGG